MEATHFEKNYNTIYFIFKVSLKLLSELYNSFQVIHFIRFKSFANKLAIEKQY
jgi:hypothetical protein